MIGSVATRAGLDDYDKLDKPDFTPPSEVFPIAWTTLYVLIAIAGWRVWRAGLTAALGIWGMQLVLNFAWTPTFFVAHQILLALLIVLTLLGSIFAFLGAVRGRDRVAFWCFVPYAAWVAFASLLNGSILWLNA